MLMIKPIIIVAGEPNSIFLEIFFKSIKFKNYKSPIIIVASKKLVSSQMKKLGFKFDINLITDDFKDFKILNNKKINIINIEYAFKKNFEPISNKSNNYIEKCFDTALLYLKKNKLTKFINGPISKKYFLNGKSLGITEYLAKKIGINNNFAMLIFNKKLSVSPLTTHLAIKDVHKNISKQKIYNHVKLISKFYKKNFMKNPRFAITGLNPHCESNFKNSEEDLYIRPAIRALIKKNYRVKGPFTLFLFLIRILIAGIIILSSSLDL